GGDHYRTRLTHTLEVSQIARTIARALRLNEDLTEAIALGHDLGHTPFGHAGERALNEKLESGFRHYEQSVRVCDVLEKDGKGLNLTKEVKDGILCHTNKNAITLEGRIVKFADKIAYMNHDIDDAQKGGILTENDIPKSVKEVFGDSKSKRINNMVKSIINNGIDDIDLSENDKEAFNDLHKFMFKSVYTNKTAKSEEPKVERMIKTLFDYLCEHTEHLPAQYIKIADTDGIPRAVADYIGGMTDRYAVYIYNELFVPKSWMVF
ncbi:MAG: HD domain-containing protein, partial [Acutalibacteraceae bacterium]